MRPGIPSPVLVIQVCAAAGACGFVALAGAVQAGWTATIDRDLLLAFRSPQALSDPLGPQWFEEMVAEISALGGYPILMITAFVVLISLALLGKRSAVWFLAAALVGGIGLSQGLKMIFSRPRPDLVQHFDQVFTSSFPSGHAMLSMIVWMTLAALAVRFIPRHALRVFILVMAAALALLIGISRIYLGVHWPSDVLAGWCAGIAWSGSCWLAAHYLSRVPETGDMGRSET